MEFRISVNAVYTLSVHWLMYDMISYNVVSEWDLDMSSITVWLRQVR